MTTPVIHGIIGYTITPFSADGSAIDLPALGRSIDQLIDNGVHAIAPLGSTGEGAYLSDAEWDQVSEFSLAHVAKRVPTIVSVSDLTTAKAVRRARFAEQHGADVVMVLPASYWKLSEAEILAHYRAIGDSINTPIMLYNNPATSGTDMSVDLILNIFNTVDNVTMVKESTGDIQRMHRLTQLSGGELPFYNGSNTLAFAALAAGARGWCTAAPNLHAGLPLALYAAVQAGDLARARHAWHPLVPLIEALFAEANPGPLKALLAAQGWCANELRAPMTAASESHAQHLRALSEAVAAAD